MNATQVGPGVGSEIIYDSPTDASNGPESGQDTGYRYLSGHDTQLDTATVLSRTDSATFSLSAFDYHGWNNNYASSITVTGTLAAGGTISQVFSLTNTFSQPFQHAALGSQFSGLSRVTFHGDLRNFGYYSGAVYQLDNIEAAVQTADPNVDAAVPEATTWAMMIAGVGMAGYAMRRRQRVSVRFA